MERRTIDADPALVPSTAGRYRWLADRSARTKPPRHRPWPKDRDADLRVLRYAHFVGDERLLDRFQALGNIAIGYTVLFGICGTAYLVAFVINHFLAPRFESIDSSASATRRRSYRQDARRAPRVD